MGRFRRHNPNFSKLETGRAEIGSPARNRPKSAARSVAVAYREVGSGCRHLRQIVSKSTGSPGVIPMRVQGETKARRIPGCWRDASEAHIRSDLQRASNEASSLEDQRISLILNATWNNLSAGVQKENFVRVQKETSSKRVICQDFRPVILRWKRGLCDGPELGVADDGSR
jgi:hypothetical protein